MGETTTYSWNFYTRKALHPIIKSYFEYKDYDEIEKLWNEVKDMEKEYEEELQTMGVSVNDIDDEDLFN